MNKATVSMMIVGILAGVVLVASLDGFSSRTEPNAQRVPLPDIAGEYFTTIIHDESPESSRLMSYFETDPVLNRIRNRERHNELASTDPYYTENFQPRLKEGNSFPIFLVQNPKGDTCLILSKSTIPGSAEKLRHLIKRRCHPDKPPVKTVVEKIKKVALVADTVKKIATPNGKTLIESIAFLISLFGSGGYLIRTFTKPQGI